MRLTFYGGAGQVTGANYLLDFGNTKILIECGLNQGNKYAEEQNYADFKYNPEEVGAIFISHSHMDHVGRLPRLYKKGFRGAVYGSKPSMDLMITALPNSLSLIKDEAKRDGHEALYSQEDITGIIGLSHSLDYHEPVDLGNGIYAAIHDAGHILGSSIIEIRWPEGNQTKRIYFSGDLGNPPMPFLKPTEYIKNADYIVIESAYGDRIHEDKDSRKEELENAIENTAKNGGTLLIPSFAMERTQEVLFELNELMKNKRVPKMPVFLDSPLAIKITKVYKKYTSFFNKGASGRSDLGEDIFNFPGLVMTETSQKSKSINDIPAPKIIIAGSGMSQGGRILHHERRYLPDPKSTILFIGYQVAGSLGRRILEGDKQVKIFGEKINVMSTVKAIGGYSAHADQPALVKWARSGALQSKDGKSCEYDKLPVINPTERQSGLKKVFIVQGEESASIALATKISDTLAIDSVVPKEGDEFEL